VINLPRPPKSSVILSGTVQYNYNLND